MTFNAASTEIDSGVIWINSTGEIDKEIGFKPDYVEFISAQQIESPNFFETDPQHNDCPDNVNGWAEGSAIFDSSTVDKQFSVASFRNSDNTDGHGVAASTASALKLPYVFQNATICDYTNMTVVKPLNNGFKVDVVNKYSAYNEMVRFKAYQFPDNMDFTAGMVKITSKGVRNITNIGFRPANIHIRGAQQLTFKNGNETWYKGDRSTNLDTTNGRSKGYATLDKKGSVVDQQSIGTASNSQSTNAHRSLASDSDIINTVYTDREGNVEGRFAGHVESAHGDGFSLDITDKRANHSSVKTDEVLLYRAWGFSYYNFTIGYKVYNYTNWGDTQPNDGNNNEDRGELYPDDGTWNDETGSDSNEGVCEYPDGSYNTTSQVSWSEANSTCVDWGGHLAIIQNSQETERLAARYSSTKWFGWYQKSGSSEPGGGWKWVEPGWGKFYTGFNSSAIDIYAEQQISSINKEVQTPSNSGCDNAGGWSNGFYNAREKNQWAISTGRTSASQNTHRYGSTTKNALMNLYRGGQGIRSSCGQFNGTVTDVDDTGFTVNISHNQAWKTNYTREMIYFRAFNFLLEPPRITDLYFQNSTANHSFKVIAEVSEGSNDISSCKITAESDGGNSETYSGTINQVNDTHSRCVYDSISYDDMEPWKDRHDSNGELLRLQVDVEVQDIDGQKSTASGSNTFPNHEPEATKLYYSNYSAEHAFNLTAELTKLDSNSSVEATGCEFKFDDGDGNTVLKEGKLDHSVGNGFQANCTYSSVNSSMPYSGGSSMEPGFQPKESIDIKVNATDHHGNESSKNDGHEIPNEAPFVYNPEPEDGSTNTENPVNLEIGVSDNRGDPIDVYFYNDTDGTLIGKKEDVSSGSRVSRELKISSSNIFGKYEWRVRAEDDWADVEEVYSFKNIVSTRARTGIDYEYSSVILMNGSSRRMTFNVKGVNRGFNNTTTTLSGVNAYFSDGSTEKTYNVSAGEVKEFFITVNPVQEGRQELVVTTRNKNLDISEKEVIPVYAEKTVNSEAAREVPGIGLTHVLLIAAISTLFYYRRL